MNTLEFAIGMEVEGQKYYLEQSEKNTNNELYQIFQLLAASEKEHAELLKNRQMQKEIEYKNNNTLSDIRGVFAGMQNFKGKLEQTTKQIDVYRLALTMEEKSISLYFDMLSQADNQQDKELFIFLLQQEKEHRNLFEDLVILLLRPEEWVESAEFGVREEY